MNKRLLVLLGYGTSLLLSGCAVYLPMQCAAPQITDKKQVELTGSTYLNGRLEGAVAYSPVRHLLVRAAYCNLPGNSNDSTYYRSRQYEVGAGTYWPLGPHWLVGGLWGVGQAYSEARYLNSGQIIFLSQSVQHEFDAKYNKMFGEAYGIFQASQTISFGAAYRVTQVHFTTLTDLGVPQTLRNMTRSEPMAFIRTRLGSGPTEDRPIQLQLTWGASSSFGYKPASPGQDNTDFQLKKSRGYTTLGISFYPHCIARRFKQNHIVN